MKRTIAEKKRLIKEGEIRKAKPPVFPEAKLRELYVYYIERSFVNRESPEHLLERGVRGMLRSAKLLERLHAARVGNDEYHAQFPFVAGPDDKLEKVISHAFHTRCLPPTAAVLAPLLILTLDSCAPTGEHAKGGGDQEVVAGQLLAERAGGARRWALRELHWVWCRLQAERSVVLFRRRSRKLVKPIDRLLRGTPVTPSARR